MSARLSTGRRSACSGLMYEAVSTIVPANVPATVSVGELLRSTEATGAACTIAANPKSRTFTSPAGDTITLPGFKSRCTTPRSCAASSASAIWRANVRVLGGEATARDHGRELAWHQFHHQRATGTGFDQSMDDCDVRMIQRGQHLGFAVEARKPLRIAGEGLWQNLDRDLALQLRVARAIDLAHATGAERGQDFVRAEARAGCEG